MGEGQSAVYEIRESSPAAVEAMLRYIYTGDFECPIAELPRLLDLSVQYELSFFSEEVALSDTVAFA